MLNKLGRNCGLLAAILPLVFALPECQAVIVSNPGLTPVDLASPVPMTNFSGRLGTAPIVPDADEKPFYDRLPVSERITGSMHADYSLDKKDGTYVSWLGIVRDIKEDAAANRTTLTVQHTYCDAVSDTHIMTVSFFGAGDFKVQLKGVGLPILPLRLIRVYGTVKRVAAAPPVVQAEFLKEWDWGRFTLMEYGVSKGNPAWLKLCKFSSADIYHPLPDAQYYKDSLGDAPVQLFYMLTDEQRKKYVDGLQFGPRARYVMSAAENAPRFVGKKAVLTGGSTHAPAALGFKKPEDYIQCRKGDDEQAKLEKDGELVHADPGDECDVVAYKLFPETSVAVYQVKLLAGKNKDETWWFPGFFLEEPKPAAAAPPMGVAPQANPEQKSAESK